MSKRVSWIVSAVVAVLIIAFLIWVAMFRFAAPLVSPAPPTPDYALQAVIAMVGSVAVLLAFVVTGSSAARFERRRSRIITIGGLVIIGIGVLTAILALTIPA